MPQLGMPWTVDRPPVASSPVTPDAGPGTALTLAALTDFALRRNPSTAAAWAAALADGAGVDAARALLAPSVNLNTTATITYNSAADAADAAGTARSLAPTLSLGWVLFDFGARQAGVDAARWQAVASQLAYNRALQTVVNGVEQAYFMLLGLRQLDAALQLGVDAAQASLDAAQARRRAGVGTVGDNAQAEAALADARLQQLRARAQRRSAEGALAAAVGIDVGTPLELADDKSDSRVDTAPPAQVAQLLASARLSRADLLALDAQVQQARAQAAAARAQGRPQLALAAQAGRNWRSGGPDGNSAQLALTLSIPLFDGGLARAQTRQAELRAQGLAAQREQQRQAVELGVWQSFQLVDSAGAVIDSAQTALRAATVAEAAARERYAAGVGSLLELLVAQATSAQARVAVVQARYDTRLALSQLAYAVGAVSLASTRP